MRQILTIAQGIAFDFSMPDDEFQHSKKSCTEFISAAHQADNSFANGSCVIKC